MEVLNVGDWTITVSLNPLETQRILWVLRDAAVELPAVIRTQEPDDLQAFYAAAAAVLELACYAEDLRQSTKMGRRGADPSLEEWRNFTITAGNYQTLLSRAAFGRDIRLAEESAAGEETPAAGESTSVGN